MIFDHYVSQAKTISCRFKVLQEIRIHTVAPRAKLLCSTCREVMPKLVFSFRFEVIASYVHTHFQVFLDPLYFISDIHSWARLTGYLAVEKRLSLIANSNLAQLNGKMLKSKSPNFHVRYKKMCFSPLRPLRAPKPLNYISPLICFFKPLNPLNSYRYNFYRSTLEIFFFSIRCYAPTLTYSQET